MEAPLSGAGLPAGQPTDYHRGWAGRSGDGCGAGVDSRPAPGAEEDAAARCRNGAAGIATTGRKNSLARAIW